MAKVRTGDISEERKAMMVKGARAGCLNRVVRWKGGSITVRKGLSLSLLFLLIFLVPNLILAEDRIPIVSDSGVVAYIDHVWSRFPREDGQGEVGLSFPDSTAHDAKRNRLYITSGRKILVVNDRFEVEATISNTSTATHRALWLDTPRDIAVDSKGRVYIVDSGGKTLHVLDPELNHVTTTIVPDERPGTPHCVAVDSQDRVFIGDYRPGGYSRILVYVWEKSKDEMILQSKFQFNPPDEPAVCADPVDIVVDSQDRVIVSETTSTTVWPNRERAIIFDKEFRWVATLGFKSKDTYPGQFRQVDGVAVGPSDMIIISDRGSGYISFFFSNGTYAGRIRGGGLCFPSSLLLMEDGHLLVGDNTEIREIDVEWVTLHPVEISTEPQPLPIPIPETCLVSSLLLFLTLVMKSQRPSKSQTPVAAVNILLCDTHLSESAQMTRHFRGTRVNENTKHHQKLPTPRRSLEGKVLSTPLSDRCLSLL